MVSDARPSGIAPPTIPCGVLSHVLAPLASRPFGEDFFKTEKRGVARLTAVKHMPHSATHAVVIGKSTDTVTHDLAGCLRAQPLLVAVIGEVQQVAAFHFLKHLWPSELAWEKLAQKMVNIWLRHRTMEAVHA